MNSTSWNDLLTNETRLRRRSSLRSVAPRDLLALTRSAMGASHADSLLEADSPLRSISHDFLAQHGMRRTGGSIDMLPWQPSWLELGGYPVGESSARRVRRQQVRSVEADDFYLRTLGRASYRTPGQRLAARCAVSTSSRDVLTCVLPTGSGKTDVFLLRAVQLRPRQTVVIVPTVSLALDLERRVRELRSSASQFAYHGALGDADKATFRERVRSGEQWLTITSPEAACTSLAKALEQAATAGRLGLLVIDEAHIVAEWGDDFRLEFQTLATLRRRLEEVAPTGRAPATILLTGTLDQHGYNALRRLFPGRNEVLVSDQSTRPEPEWWSSKCDDEDTKRARLLEAVAHLPRPLLIYTSLHSSPRSTTVADVHSWLSEAGYRAIRGVAGASRTDARIAAVTGLRLASPNAARDVDIVVATSAFGMGVDIDDIRAVIHVCLPESVNRLYQEVGRGGRDGRATTSLVLWTEADLDVAKGLAEAKQITGATAWIRWERLRLGRVRDRRVTVDLTTPHPGVSYPFSDANRYWNLQTLLGMQRAGMIRIEWPDPPAVSLDADDDELADAFARQRNEIDVSVLHSDLVESRFVERFNRERSEVVSIGNASYGSALEMVQELDATGQRSCLSARLSNHYRFVDQHTGLVPVTVDCGGCPSCRQAGTSLRRHRQHPYASGRLSATNLGLEELFGSNNVCCVEKRPLDPELEEAFFRRLTRRRTVRLVGSSDLEGPRRAVDDSAIVWWESANQFYQREMDPTDVLTVLLTDEIADDEKLFQALTRLERLSYGIVYTSPKRVDPEDRRFLLVERYPLKWTLETVLSRL